MDALSEEHGYSLDWRLEDDSPGVSGPGLACPELLVSGSDHTEVIVKGDRVAI